MSSTLSALLLVTAACGGTPPTPVDPPTLTNRPADRDRLAALAAAAKDRRYVATYTLTEGKRTPRTVTVAVAADGSWIVAVPGGALGGLADVAMFRSSAGLFQCALGPADGSALSRPDLAPVSPGCVRATALAARADPRVHHVFTDWIDPLLDRATALSVTATDPLPGAAGVCFSVESNSAALAPPVDPGVYCYSPDGVLTAVRVGFGSLILTGAVGAAPPTVAMPAPVVRRGLLGQSAPPPRPSPSASATPSVRPPA